MSLAGRLARAWNAFWSPAEPPQVHYHVTVDRSLQPDQIKLLAEEVQAQLLKQARSNGPRWAA